MELQSVNPFTTEEIYNFEEVTAKYLQELLTNDDSHEFLKEPESVIDVSVTVQMQKTIKDSFGWGDELYMGSKVDIVHYGDFGIMDVAALLNFLVNKNNTDSSFIYLDHILDSDAPIQLINFDFISESVPAVTNLTTIEELNLVKNAKKYGSEKTLIVVTTILSITLFGMSAILIWVGGGWLVLRKRVRELVLREEELTRMTMNYIESKPTADTEDGDEESPSGRHASENPSSSNYMRGTRSPFYGLGVKTPSRMGSAMSADDLATPMSVMSDYSDTNRAPLGIMSMRKLVPPRGNNDTPSRSPYRANGTKKLQY